MAKGRMCWGKVRTRNERGSIEDERSFRKSLSHEPRRQCHDTRPVLLEEQPAIVFDILPGVIVVAVALDELTYVSNSFAETSIQVDEGNTKARREERARRRLACTAGPNESNHARYSSGSVQERGRSSRPSRAV